MRARDFAGWTVEQIRDRFRGDEPGVEIESNDDGWLRVIFLTGDDEIQSELIVNPVLGDANEYGSFVVGYTVNIHDYN